MDAIHGGGQYDLIGHDLSSLERRDGVVPADVLDAWFDPAPGVVRRLESEAAWMCRTSPPAHPHGVEASIAEAYGIPSDCVTVGAGSSDLIYRGLIRMLDRTSRVFLIDPTYSEYRHVCSNVVRCSVDHGDSLASASGEYDLIVVVNPNNPTGVLLPLTEIAGAASCLTHTGKVWVDEAYLPYVRGGESAKSLAARDERFIVCQSLSKSLALSGLRAAFMVSTPSTSTILRQTAPPWLLSTAASLAVVAALEDDRYYQARYEETYALRTHLAVELRSLKGTTVAEGAANWVTVESPLSAESLIASCKGEGVLVRDGRGMFMSPPERFVRIAVRSQHENARTVQAVSRALADACVAPALR
jgi:histidinol-phosphate/aromatic aminotransferase/cobyric acid decarboxylase-like protein